MALDITHLPIESGFGVTIPNTLLTQDPPADRLLVLLPGRGYLNEHPVMHYLMNVALARGYDVLLVTYGFQTAHVTFFPEQLSLILRETQQVVDAALRTRPYRTVCIAGKSLGTLLAWQVLQPLSTEQRALLLLTPVQNSHAQTDLPTLAVIGTADSAYLTNDMTPRPNVTWRIYEGLNHSLEHPDDWRASLAALPEIMSACDAFLARW